MSRITKVAAVMAGTGALIAGGAGMASADAGAQGAAIGSPGVLSGNVVQVPIHVPVNVCGNTVNVIGLLNPAFGNTCVNADGGHDDKDKGDYGHGR
ncbi:chaplin [Streptomyces cyaneofuscatus]|uniref:chaplin n=1 Tax=Streptomyces cyaneofuscatus TaxID=66883 RepID=UPI0033218C13